MCVYIYIYIHIEIEIDSFLCVYVCKHAHTIFCVFLNKQINVASIMYLSMRTDILLLLLPLLLEVEVEEDEEKGGGGGRR